MGDTGSAANTLKDVGYEKSTSDPTWYGNIMSGLKAGPGGLPSTYKDPSLSPGNKSMRMLAEVGAGTNRTLGGIGQVGNAYDQLTAGIEKWSAGHRAESEEKRKTTALIQNVSSQPHPGGMISLESSGAGMSGLITAASFIGKLLSAGEGAAAAA